MIDMVPTSNPLVRRGHGPVGYAMNTVPGTG